jgi:hypothetical protein
MRMAVIWDLFENACQDWLNFHEGMVVLFCFDGTATLSSIVKRA